MIVKMELILKNVTKIIKGVTVIEDVSVKWSSGKVYGLKGYNGAGKTMLMRLISGLVTPSRGEILVDGKHLGKDISFPERMGLLLERPGFLPEYTAYQNLRLITQLGKNISQLQIDKVLRYVGLNGNDKKKYKKFSLGMKQRLALAAAVMEEPDIILLDEPTNALDAAGVEMAKQLILGERNRGALVVVASHDSEILYELSDTVYTIDKGKVEDIYEKRKHN